MSTPFCPATMCPLFAAGGSPWTGEKNARCSRQACAWWGGARPDHCSAGEVAALQVVESWEKQNPVFQAGPVRAQKAKVEPKTFDCPRAGECQWQKDAGDRLCPPRLALSIGVDPRTAAF